MFAITSGLRWFSLPFAGEVVYSLLAPRREGMPPENPLNTPGFGEASTLPGNLAAHSQHSLLTKGISHGFDEGHLA